MIEREKSNNRSIPSIQDFPPCIFYCYLSFFFLSFCGLFLGSCQVKNHFIRYHINTHTHTCTNTNVFFDYFYRCFREDHLQGTRMRYYFRFFWFAWVSSTAISNTSRALSYNPIVSFLSQDGKKDDFCADDEKSILMRPLICDVANGNATSQSRA